ncbi:MAG: hypothetical protein P1U53_10605 [Sulfitobacter sp.]|nr:hypothetical protein [Sulfitobacter sp.]
MEERFSLRDHLFNEESIGQLAREYAAALPDFDSEAFRVEVLAGFPERGLLERLDWIADCLEPRLSADFPAMADQLEAAMPAPLDPKLTDDDFGRFIHAVPGIMAVRHGLEDHRDRALDLLHAATRRFSMEFYIRPFLNRWPGETLARLALWAQDSNYHVRRLVSEGTRPRLPWARAVRLDPDETLPLLDQLHEDDTRYVTRSVANHLNDIAKADPERVVHQLAAWRAAGRQKPTELDWICRHALRSLIKSGHAGTMEFLGYRHDVAVRAALTVGANSVRIGDQLRVEAVLEAEVDLPVIVDYRMIFARPGGKRAEKVFKLKVGKIMAGKPLRIGKNHRFKGDATTFTLHPGLHEVVLQVNGRDLARAEVMLED